MKPVSFIRKLTAAVLSCTLCCTGMTVPAFSEDGSAELPARFDWRDADPPILTPVKNQYGGTCWAYALIGCAESSLIKNGLTDCEIDLSESHLIWFCSGEPAPTDPDNPCYGSSEPYGTKAYRTVPRRGDFYPPIASLAAWQGVIRESDAPLHREEQPLDESLRYQSLAHLQNAEVYDPSDMLTIKTQLMEKGALFCGYYNDHDHPLSEQSGYYNSDYTKEKQNKGLLNGGPHAVVLVGWDDNYPKENFTAEPPGNGAWIIRNSYGENYKNSDHGYFYLSYYEESFCDIRSLDFEPVTNYGAVHHYNSSQVIYYYPSSSSGYVTANVFTAEKNEKIAAVGFFTDKPDTEYEISFYMLNAGFTNPEDGTLVAKLSGSEEHNGFHTLKLPQSLAVETGQQYAVVLKTPLGACMFIDEYCKENGTSFYKIYTDGTAAGGKPRDWTDCFDVGVGDICIHVYTEYEGETAQILRGDMDRDGRLTAADLSLMKQAIREPVRSDLYQPAADWNSDNEINAEDARGLLNYLLTTTKPAGKSIDEVWSMLAASDFSNQSS